MFAVNHFVVALRRVGHTLPMVAISFDTDEISVPFAHRMRARVAHDPSLEVVELTGPQAFPVDEHPVGLMTLPDHGAQRFVDQALATTS